MSELITEPVTTTVATQTAAPASRKALMAFAETAQRCEAAHVALASALVQLGESIAVYTCDRYAEWLASGAPTTWDGAKQSAYAEIEQHASGMAWCRSMDASEAVKLWCVSTLHPAIANKPRYVLQALTSLVRLSPGPLDAQGKPCKGADGKWHPTVLPNPIAGAPAPKGGTKPTWEAHIPDIIARVTMEPGEPDDLGRRTYPVGALLVPKDITAALAVIATTYKEPAKTAEQVAAEKAAQAIIDAALPVSTEPVVDTAEVWAELTALVEDLDDSQIPALLSRLCTTELVHGQDAAHVVTVIVPTVTAPILAAELSANPSAVTRLRAALALLPSEPVSEPVSEPATTPKRNRKGK